MTSPAAAVANAHKGAERAEETVGGATPRTARRLLIRALALRVATFEGDRSAAELLYALGDEIATRRLK